MVKSLLLRLAVIALFLVVEHASAKPKGRSLMVDVYPDVRRCYKKFTRPDELTALEAQNKNIANCISEYKDQKSFCYRNCLLMELSLISISEYHKARKDMRGRTSRYFVYYIETSKYPFGQELLGVNEDRGNKVTDRLMERYSACAKNGVVKLPLDTPGECHLLAREHKKQLEKIHKCIETALTCKNEMDDIDPKFAHTEASEEATEAPDSSEFDFADEETAANGSQEENGSGEAGTEEIIEESYEVTDESET